MAPSLLFSGAGEGDKAAERVEGEAAEGVETEELSDDSSGASSEREEEGEEEGEEEEVQLSPDELLALGKKCLAAGDASGAVNHFQEACFML